jgi:lipoprotein-releasing system ATP-binding protein
MNEDSWHPGSTELSDQIILKTEKLTKSFGLREKRVEVLRGIDLTIHAGGHLAIMGVSGAGKTTLLQILGTLDSPTSGRVFYRNEDLSTWDDDRLAAFRNKKVGFIFQFHHLLPEFTAIENAMMPSLIRGTPRKEARFLAEEVLVKLGLKDRLTHKQGELSGGEQQRVAIARAIALQPEIILSDEPTGNLDMATGEGIFQLLLDLNRELNIALVVVTHNESLAKRMPRRITLVDGRVAADEEA